MTTEEQIIYKLIETDARTRADFTHVLRSVYSDNQEKGYHRNIILRDTYEMLVAAGDIDPSEAIEKLLVTKSMRSRSGVAVITVLTKPYECPGKCIYCPTETDVPKSYLSNEPAVMRAILNKYYAANQVKTRLESLIRQGHPVDKIELIIIGGTFSHLPRDYQENFVKDCFDALNGKVSDSLDEAKKLNETAVSRCVGLTLETRPDHISEDEVKWFRYLGATRVELGVQTVFDEILTKNGRGEKVADTVGATRLLKNAGFKICYHLMPNLYGSDLETDKKMFQTVFESPDFRPDYIKIYPCMVLAGTGLYELWKKGEYKSYTDLELKDLIKYVKTIVPPWVRIMRTIRDIPAPSIESGSTLSNMRQIVLAEMSAEGKKCGCIRCREVGTQASCLQPPASRHSLEKGNPGNAPEILNQVQDDNIKLFFDKYDASEGTEYFLSYENEDRSILYSLLRLRFPSTSLRGTRQSLSQEILGQAKDDKNSNNTQKALSGSAIIREVHTYGQQIEIGESGETQHRGFGRKLIAEAEKIAKKNGYEKIAVISGVGVRGYYRKFAYELEGEYMVKIL